jgi:hypothetical protein
VTQFAGIRKTSSLRVGNLPLLSIAIGPDLEKGEIRGMRRASSRIGDMAAGWVAIGGLAFGGVALGGLSAGVVAIGGLSIAAVAFGGLSISIVALGRLSVGYYACGGAAFGQYVMSAVMRDPEAVELFGRFLPWLKR